MKVDAMACAKLREEFGGRGYLDQAVKSSSDSILFEDDGMMGKNM